MKSRILRPLTLVGAALLLHACSEKPEQASLLRLVPADTPYVYAHLKPLPEATLGKLIRMQSVVLGSYGSQLDTIALGIEKDAKMDKEQVRQLQQTFGAAKAFVSELSTLSSMDAYRAAGIDPNAPGVIFGLGMFPAMHFQILDPAKFNAFLDRVEQRAGIASANAELNGQAYRRYDLKSMTIVVSAHNKTFSAALLPNALFDEYLPLALGQQAPQQNLLGAGTLAQVEKQYGFDGHGDGYVDVRSLVATALGKGAGRNAQTWKVMGVEAPAASAQCVSLGQNIADAMPRYVFGIREIDTEAVTMHSMLETAPAVAAVLQKIATPLPAGDAQRKAIMEVGYGANTTELGNGIESLLRFVIAQGKECELVDAQQLQTSIPSIKLTLGMASAVKGFHLAVNDVQLDPATMQPQNVDFRLQVLSDEPSMLLSLVGALNPAMAGLSVPETGEPAAIPQEMLPPGVPPLSIDQTPNALSIQSPVADKKPAASKMGEQPQLIVVNYNLEKLATLMETVLQGAAQKMDSEDPDQAKALRDQVAMIRAEADVIEHMQFSMYATERGLAGDYVLNLK